MINDIQDRIKNLKNSRTAFILVAIFLLVCAVFVTHYVRGNVSGKAASVDDNYYFQNVSVDITVNRDKTFNITETLTAVFLQDGINTGIIRDIQRESKTTRIIDGVQHSGKRYIAGLDGVSVTLDGREAKVTKTHDADFYSIKMQVPYTGYISAGEHVFVLSYIYDMGDDKLHGFDDFTFDILGYAMAYTQTFNARITFPEGTDLSGATFRTDDRETWVPDSENSEYISIRENVITVFASPQAENKGYTIQVLLPDGYFDCSLTLYWQYWLFFALALTGIALCLGIIFAGYINKRGVVPVEYFPPDDIDIMHCSAAWHRGARYKDIGALILQWAAKGLINIVQDGKRHLRLIPDWHNNMKKFEKTLSGMSVSERQLFEAMFLKSGSSKTFSTREFKKLSYSSKKSVYNCTEKLVDKGNKPKPYIISGGVLATILPFVSLIPTLAVMLYYSFIDYGFACLFLLIFMVAGTFVGTQFNKIKNPIILIFPIMFYGALYFTLLFWAPHIYDYAGMLYIAPVWWALCLFVFPYFVKGIRSKAVQDNYIKLCGFKNFLLLTELDRIQLVFDENPDYFAEILPYCYVLGISKKVQKRFASLNFVKPNYIAHGINPAHVVRCTTHSCCYSSSGIGGGGSHGGGGGGGGSRGGGGGGGGSRGC